MRRYIFVLVLSLLTMAAAAQNRVVRGVVFDSSRRPFQGAVISSDDKNVRVESKVDGTFEITVPTYTRFLVAGKDGFLSQTLEIDGSYLVFTMKVDKNWEKEQAAKAAAREKFVADSLATVQAAQKTASERAAKEEAARIASEKVAREKAVADSLAAVKRAEKEEAARIAAREKFVADSLAAVQKAVKEEVARIAAEKAAREKAVADSLEAVQRAVREETARIAAEKAAREKAVADSLAAEQKADKKAAQKAAVEKYDSQFKNHGLIFGLDFAYGYQVAKGDVVFKDRGWREYGDQIPLQLCFSVGYRVNYLFAISAGAGVLYDVKNISIKNDSFAPGYYPDFRLKQIDVPIFLKADLYMSKGKVQPLLSVSGGLYALSVSPLVDAGIGCSVRISKSSALNILASFRTTPWPYFDEEAKASGYKMAPTPGFKVGFSF